MSPQNSAKESPQEAPSKGRGPFFWGGLMFIAYAIIGVLAISGALEDVPLLILMLVPWVLIVPLIRSANARIDAGGSPCIAKGEAQKRYMKRIAIFTSIYLVAMALFVMMEDRGIDFGQLELAIALLPGLAMIGVFWTIGRLIVEEQDEFLRMLVIRQSLIATAISLSAASVWGFLETAEIVPHADAWWWPIVWFFGLFVGAVINRIQYGSWGAV
ncbi:hypothetical protein ACRAQ7_04505 [Erythrobacter sp. W53]|uniref:hypothetical protein n=1 Tax=Erythrobacter sp. W53 TaxID=3425947 RepID=UPI003D76692B